VRVLLTDGSGLTSRQVATHLSVIGHEVEALSPDRLALTRFTRHVRRVHAVPPYGIDPFAWLDAALGQFREGGFDVLYPTQEQVAVLAASAQRLAAEGVASAVPTFDSLVKVQDKLSAHATLTELRLPQPDATICDAAGLAGWQRLPVFVKAPIGTATAGVRYVTARDELKSLAAEWEAEDLFADAGVLIQSPVAGELVMVQAVFCHGRLVASHANLRVREGARGGASHKQSIDLPEVRQHLEALGEHLVWHGALSLDAILTDDGPSYIDVNPRLVEPGNAWRAGVDLVGPMLDLATGVEPRNQPRGTPGVSTHQLLLAILGAAQHQQARRAVLAELVDALAHRGEYHDSTEELTPLRHDLPAAAPLVIAASATLAWPATWRWFSSSAVTNYALTNPGWRKILAYHAAQTGTQNDKPARRTQRP
jgi:biotin carboxylase